MADITFAALAVLIGKDYLTVWTVVYQCSVTEYQTFFEHFQEDPLCPFVVILVCSVNHTVPVKGESYSL